MCYLQNCIGFCVYFIMLKINIFCNVNNKDALLVMKFNLKGNHITVDKVHFPQSGSCAPTYVSLKSDTTKTTDLQLALLFY